MITFLFQLARSGSFDSNLETTSHFAGFLTLVEESEWAFEEVYCAVFLALAEHWARRNPKYMDFPVVLDQMKTCLTNALNKKPRDLTHFRSLLKDFCTNIP